jgi:hypothetical protein
VNSIVKEIKHKLPKQAVNKALVLAFGAIAAILTIFLYIYNIVSKLYQIVHEKSSVITNWFVHELDDEIKCARAESSAVSVLGDIPLARYHFRKLKLLEVRVVDI